MKEKGRIDMQRKNEREKRTGVKRKKDRKKKRKKERTQKIDV